MGGDTFTMRYVYHKTVSHCVQVTKASVFNDGELQQQFKMFVYCLWQRPVREETIHVLYKEVVSMVINTMSNSFFQWQNVLSRIAQDIGVDAQVTLRDKLKVYARESRSRLRL